MIVIYLYNIIILTIYIYITAVTYGTPLLLLYVMILQFFTEYRGSLVE
jgi:hypothetical protein